MICLGAQTVIGTETEMDMEVLVLFIGCTVSLPTVTTPLPVPWFVTPFSISRRFREHCGVAKWPNGR